jgi:hypothetical protein
MPTLYEVISASAQEQYVIITHHGEGTPFEAVSRVEMDIDTAHWDGWLLFKDARFSPCESELPGLGLRYGTPGGASGVVAVVRARNMHARLVAMFTALMGTSDDGQCTMCGEALTMQRCDMCDGTGEAPTTRHSDIVDGEPCELCHGIGQYAQCSRVLTLTKGCDGNG